MEMIAYRFRMNYKLKKHHKEICHKLYLFPEEKGGIID